MRTRSGNEYTWPFEAASSYSTAASRPPEEPTLPDLPTEIIHEVVKISAETNLQQIIDYSAMSNPSNHQHIATLASINHTCRDIVKKIICSRDKDMNIAPPTKKPCLRWWRVHKFGQHRRDTLWGQDRRTRALWQLRRLAELEPSRKVVNPNLVLRSGRRVYKVFGG